MRVLFTLAAIFILAACQSTVDGSATRGQSSGIASATATDAGIEVVTQAGSRHTFQREEVCGGQTWMRVGPERFQLNQRGTSVQVSGVPVQGLNCPPRATGGGGGNIGGESLQRSQQRSGAMSSGETQGSQGTTPSGSSAGFSAISG